jgi:pimeloyl-ACP methyl ester carboxylesterase
MGDHPKTGPIGPPKLLHSFGEVARATVEFWALQAGYQHLKLRTPKGAPRAILVIPGFGAGDVTTHQLRRFLKDKGHEAYGWDRGINTGPGQEVFIHLKNQLDRISDQHNVAHITVIGHSLGGIYARELARAFPDQVAQVITLGSPFGAGAHPQSTSLTVRKVFEIANGKDNPFLNNAALAAQSLTPPPVPTTSIYSRSDGVVHWKTCINPKTKRAENVEVHGSHCGLVLNPLAFTVIADRLAQNPKDWAAFKREDYSAWMFRDDQAHHGVEPKLPKARSKGPRFDLFK